MQRMFVLLVGLGLAGCAVESATEEDLAEDDIASATEAARPQFCGGIAGFPCPTGYECVDDPHDSCDPNNGGADCGGICKRANGGGRGGKRCNDPARDYVSRDPDQCAAILFLCVDGMQPFFDSCGCGCEPIQE